jgi:copper transporter 1
MPLFLYLFLLAFSISQTLALLNEACVKDSTTPSCEGFTLSRDIVNSDMDNLCKSMPYMPGCSLQKWCRESSQLGSEKICAPLTILASVCKADMPKMNGCDNYASMCGNATTVVKQCTQETLPQDFMTTDKVNEQIQSICTEMNMDGCSDCKLRNGEKYANCDLLGTYGKLCKAMPDMSQCGDWKKMCKADMSKVPQVCGGGKSALESSELNDAPVMRMYFHQSFEDYFLFKEWVPRNGGQYGGSLIAVFVLGIVFQFISAARYVRENYWRKEYGGRHPTSIRGMFSEPFIWSVELSRAAFCAVEVTMAYFLMLLAMTYNGGVFVAVVLGISTGRFMFGRIQPEHAQVSNCH